MIKIKANGTTATVEECERLTTGRVGLPIILELSEEWDGLVKTVVCSAGGVVKDVAVLPGADLTVPHECLVKSGVRLTIGIYGTTQDGHIVIPTIYADAGKIYKGADPSGEEEHDPTPSEVEQILAAASEAVTVAQSVRDDANAGAFDGAQGEQGPAGTGIVSIVKTGTATIDGRIVDTYTVTLSNGQTATFTVTNGKDGEGGSGGTGDYNELTNKPKINGTTLQGNISIPIPTKISDLDNDVDFVEEDDLAAVATSGDYNDLTNKPAIPDELSDLTEDSTHRLVTDTEKANWNNKSDFSGNYSDLNGKPSVPTVSDGPEGIEKINDSYLMAKYDEDGNRIKTTYAKLSDIPDDLADLNADSTHRLVTDVEKAKWNGKEDKLVYDYDQTFTIPQNPNSTIYIELPTVGLTEFRLTITTPEAVVAASTGYFYISTGMSGNVMNNRGRFFEPTLTQSHSTTHDIVFYPGRGGLYDMRGYKYGNTSDTDYSLFTHYSLARQNLGKSFFNDPAPITGIWFTVSGAMSDLVGTTVRIRGLKYVSNN